MARNTFRTIPGYTLPTLTPEGIALLHELSSRFKIDAIRFTTASSVGVAGLDDESFTEFSRALIPIMTPRPANGITTIHSCNERCRCDHECADTGVISRKLTTLEFEQPLPAKLKVAVAGCTRSCTMVRVRDIGIYPDAAIPLRWTISFGGNGGARPRIGDVLATGLNVSEAMETVRTAVNVYRSLAEKRERTAVFLDRIGIDRFSEEIARVLDPGQTNLPPEG